MKNELIHAIKSLLQGLSKDPLPENHPGHEAYLNTVAIPRAQKALKNYKEPKTHLNKKDIILLEKDFNSLQSISLKTIISLIEKYAQTIKPTKSHSQN